MKNQRVKLVIIGGLQQEREALQKCLKKATEVEYLINLTDSGVDGLMMSQSDPPDCILLDYCIFDMDGNEFIKRCLAQHKAKVIPIVILTEPSYNHSNSPYASTPFVLTMNKAHITIENLNKIIHQAKMIGLSTGPTTQITLALPEKKVTALEMLKQSSSAIEKMMGAVTVPAPHPSIVVTTPPTVEPENVTAKEPSLTEINPEISAEVSEEIPEVNNDAVEFVDASLPVEESEPGEFTEATEANEFSESTQSKTEAGEEKPIAAVAPPPVKQKPKKAKAVVEEPSPPPPAPIIEEVEVDEKEFLRKLPNHIVFKEILTKAISRAQRQQKLLALLVFDSEELETTKTSQGEQVYEHLLFQIVKRFQSKLRTSDCISRMDALSLGEIAILVDDISDYLDVAYIAKRLINSLSESFVVGEENMKIFGSFGIACYPIDCNASLDFHKNAVIAMYHNRQSQISNYYFFNEQLDNVAKRHECIAKDLNAAFENHEFYLNYQPIINLTTNELLAHEAYIRWNHPKLDIIGPAEFMPIAERLGYSINIGLWMLDATGREFTEWQKSEMAPERFNLKVTFAQMREADFVSKIMDSLSCSKLTTAQLALEIPNSVVTQQFPIAINNLYSLHEAGVYLTLENFPKLTVCLQDLKRYPFNALNITRNYLRTCFDNRQDMQIIKSVISIGKHMGYDVIAKGIETAKQLQLLRDLDCPFGQGYYICKPLTTSELQSALETRRKVLLSAGSQ